jgi:large subunit ribosomal protein L4
MPKVEVHNKEGKKVAEMELSDEVFAVAKNDRLVHQVYVAIASNKRQVLAHTKDRGERAGSGRKPWKQKGTGNARVGSVRSPLWKKGGIIFGPNKERNFTQKINKKMNQKAIKIMLSSKLKEKNLIVLDEINLAEKKTKEFTKIFKNLKLTGTTLIGFSEKEMDLRLYSRNIEKSKNILSSQLSVWDMLNSKNLLLSKDSVEYLEKKYK